jgi:hypothetical protein
MLRGQDWILVEVDEEVLLKSITLDFQGTVTDGNLVILGTKIVTAIWDMHVRPGTAQDGLLLIDRI